jgi:hypothetical protein
MKNNYNKFDLIIRNLSSIPEQELREIFKNLATEYYKKDTQLTKKEYILLRLNMGHSIELETNEDWEIFDKIYNDIITS